MPLPDDLRRTGRGLRCPVCGGNGWCTVSKEGGAEPLYAFCNRRATSEAPRGELGWFHRLAPGRIDRGERRGAPLEERPVDHRREAERLFRQADHQRIARELELEVDALRRLGIGWCPRQRCSTWPELDAELRVVGINCRFDGGDKRLRRGDRVGLFMPSDLPADLSAEHVLVLEGGTDSAAGLSLGRWCIGRHAALSAFNEIKRLLRRRRPLAITIVAHRDSGIGLSSAQRLAVVLEAVCRDVRVILPPDGIKDLRDWIKAGGTAGELARIEEAAR